jgi:hypothetical protein
MAHLGRKMWLRVLLALHFGAATVASLAVPSLAAMLSSHHIAVHQGADAGHSNHGHSHHDGEPSPQQGLIDVASWQACAIHCLGTATLSAGLDVVRPQVSQCRPCGHRRAEGTMPARIERPPDL